MLIHKANIIALKAVTGDIMPCICVLKNKLAYICPSL